MSRLVPTLDDGEEKTSQWAVEREWGDTLDKLAKNSAGRAESENRPFRAVEHTATGENAKKRHQRPPSPGSIERSNRSSSLPTCMKT